MDDLRGLLRTLGIALSVCFVPCLLLDQFITAYVTPRYTAWQRYDCFPDMRQCAADFDGDGRAANLVYLGDADYNRSLRVTDGGASLSMHYRRLSVNYRTHLLRSPETARPRLLIYDRTNDPQLAAVYEWRGNHFALCEPTQREQAMLDALDSYYGVQGAFFCSDRNRFLLAIFLLIALVAVIWHGVRP